MADLRIVDAPEIPTENITGEEKLPTGGNGNYSISLDSVADFTTNKKDLADNSSVDGKVNGVRQELNTHIEDSTNPHQVTKDQVGLGNVDNTADLDKPVSNSTQSAIISAVAPKADKTYVDSQDLSLQSQINQKATAEYLDNVLTEQTNTVNTALSNLSTVASKFYPTLTEANADIANIAVNQVVNIGEVANGGLWYKATEGATSLNKSAYDPLTQANENTKQEVEENIATTNGSDVLLSNQGRAFSYSNGNPVTGGTSYTLTDDGVDIKTISSSLSTLLSSRVALKIDESCIIKHKFKFTEITSTQVMCGLTFNNGANLRNLNVRNDGTIFTTKQDGSTSIVLESAQSNAVFSLNQEVTCTYDWDGSSLSIQVETLNGKTGKYQITELSDLNSDIKIGQRGIGMATHIRPIEVIKTDSTLSSEILLLTPLVEKNSNVVGVIQDTQKIVDNGISNSNGSVATGTSVSKSGNNVIVNVSTSSSRNSILKTSLSANEGEHHESEMTFSVSALTGTSARYIGFSIGDAGNLRRHYSWQGTGGIIEYNDSEAVISTIAPTGAARAYNVGDVCKIKIVREFTGKLTLRIYVNGVIVGSYVIANSPSGQIWINFRAAPIITYTIAKISGQGFNNATAKALSTLPQGTFAKLVNQISVPDAQAANASGGFTCTGAQQIGSTGKWAGCWIVGNHGQVYEGSTVYNPSIVLLSPDRTRKLKEWDMSVVEGIQSIQGVAWDSSDDTIWFVDKTNRIIRHIDFNGTQLSDFITAPADYTRINGIAYNPNLDAMYVQNEGVKQIKLISCADGTTVLGTWTSLSAAADQFYYYAEKNWLLYSFGENGVNGALHVLDLTSDKVLSIITLEGSQSIEGICIANNGNLVVFNDGGFHTVAKPPLNLSCEYKINFDF